ncbi:MAG: zinc-binding dehydrogenase, partial [Actinomycetota bacterium]|nr:zinc-binding dehydrogenase [Actinomycetota bacterium]
AWAERCAVSTATLSELPEEVSFEAASTLPVAGLTALRALAVGGLTLGRRVAVTGASGGVGRFALQLAARGGAHVTGAVGRPESSEGLEALGAEEVVVGLEPAGEPFDLILESVGGETLAAALSRVAPQGTIVSFGSTSGEETSFSAGALYGGASGARLYGLYVFDEIARARSGARDLATLVGLVASGELDPQIDLELDWGDARQAVEALLDRRVRGKAVLRVEGA